VIRRCVLIEPQLRHRFPRLRRLGAVKRRAAEDRVEAGHRLGYSIPTIPGIEYVPMEVGAIDIQTSM
jgi:hypothetical protein